MASVPPFADLSTESIPAEHRQWMDGLLRNLNDFGKGSVAALQGGLTFGTNMAAQLFTFSITTPAAGNNGLPYAFYYAASAQALLNGQFSLVNLDTKLADTDNAVVTGALWAFTVPAGKSGIYQVSGCGTTTSAVGTASQVVAAVTCGPNTVRFAQTNYSATPAGVAGSSGSVTVPLSAGDLVRLTVFQNTGANRVTLTNEISTYLSINCLSLNSPYVPSCFPLLQRYNLSSPPSGVWPWKVTDITSGVAQRIPLIGAVDWDFAAGTQSDSSGQPVKQLKINNIPGLLPNRKYSITLCAVAG